MLEREPQGDTESVANSEEETNRSENRPDESGSAIRGRRAATRPAGPPAAEFSTVQQVSEAEHEAASGSMSASAPAAIFQPPQIPKGAKRREADVQPETSGGDEDSPAEATMKRRRRRGGRGRGKTKERGEADTKSNGEPDEPASGGSAESAGSDQPAEQAPTAPDGDETAEGTETTTRRRRRRRRRGSDDSGDASSPDDPPNTVVKVREPRADRGDAEPEALKGSTRLEAKRQRRREGRDQRRRRPLVVSESEFLARRESVERVLVARQTDDRTQIAVLEDGVLVEHYVDRARSQSQVGNVYLGRVQNVLPSMEAAFVDIGKGRNAVLYAGEVNFDATGLDGQPKRIESALKSGQSVLVQVTKDPIGNKGARLTSQVSLPGRYLVYVPDRSMTGISRKLPERERNRLKDILRDVMPEGAGVIVRTAAEGASEEELSRDIARLTAQWEDIQKKVESGSPPELVYGEPDLTIRVVRDIFNEDFSQLVVSGEGAWDMVEPYVAYVAPHLSSRLRKWTQPEDVFAAYRIDEQLMKALDRKVWLPSGGSLVIDRTEAMVVVDVNTGKFTGKGGNLEETVTRNNLEAAEEIVRQLRLRDLGGIIVVDFIDMVLESNRELVLRRLLECLARDRTKHQVAEVTSLGLVQMTRKRVGQGLLESFSETCECCNGRGVIVRMDQIESPDAPATDRRGRGPLPSPEALSGARRITEEEESEEAPEEAVAEAAEAAADPVAAGLEPLEAESVDPADSDRGDSGTT